MRSWVNASLCSWVWQEHCVRRMKPRCEDYLDCKNHPIGRHLVTLGTATSTLAAPREVFRGAILASASALVVAHNHPSGDPALQHGEHPGNSPTSRSLTHPRHPDARPRGRDRRRIHPEWLHAHSMHRSLSVRGKTVSPLVSHREFSAGNEPHAFNAPSAHSRKTGAGPSKCLTSVKTKHP